VAVRKHSQSAVSEPTRLSVPIEARSRALNRNFVSLSASTGEQRCSGCKRELRIFEDMIHEVDEFAHGRDITFRSTAIPDE
jgi:hypothetical protein